MKKLKTILGAILRLFAVLVPGLFTGFALWKIHGALVTILAALGVEFLWSLVLAVVIAVAGKVKAQLHQRKTPAAEE